MPYCRECSVLVPAEVTECPTCGADLLEPTIEVDESGPPELDLEQLQKTLGSSLRPNYEILRPLGQGGMGAVFLAKEPTLRRLVAIKVLSPDLARDKRSRARFEREARAAAAISHPNVVRVYAVGETRRGKLPYIVMQFVDGPNLEEWRLRRGKVSEREARRIIGEVAAALGAAHARDLVHRDVKPSNVLIEKESGRAFVADFGVSAALTSTGDETKLTGTGVLVGTPMYMSPEQASGAPVTPKSDVYSLGILSYLLLTDTLPISAQTPMGWAAAHLKESPTPTAQRRPDLSPAVAQIVDRCLSKSPSARPNSTELARGMLPTVDTVVEWPPPGLLRLQGRARALVATGLGAALGAVLGAVAFTYVPEVLRAGAGWLSRFRLLSQFESSAAEIGQRASNTVVSMVLWQAALVLGLVTFVLGSVALVTSAFRTLESSLRHRRVGWRWGTLYDIAVDGDGRTGSILAGAGDFVSFAERRRKWILWARRAAPATTLLGVAWITVGFGGRSLMLLVGPGTGTLPTLFDPGETTLLLGPGLALIGAGAILLLLEQLLLGRLARPHDFHADPTDVASWYSQSSSEAADPAPPMTLSQNRRLTWLLRSAQVAFGLLLAIVVMGATLAGLAAFSAAKFPERFGPRTAEMLSLMRQIDAADPLGAARRSWERYLPPRGSLADLEATEMTAALLDPGDGEGLPRYRTPVLGFFGSGSAPVNHYARARQGLIPQDTLSLLQEIADHQRTQTVRQVAQASQVDVVRALFQDPLSQHSYFQLPFNSGRALIEAVRANELASVLDVALGRPEAAFARLGENAAIGEKFLDAPGGYATRTAIRILRDHTLEPLAQLHDARQDPTLAADSREAAQGLLLLIQLWQRSDGVTGLTSDPERLDRFSGVMTDPKVVPGYRLQWLYFAWQGLCANPREILFGPSAEREAAVLTTVAGMSDIPHAEEFARMAGAAWQYPMQQADDTGGRLSRRIERTAPWGAAGRLLMCGTFGSY